MSREEQLNAEGWEKRTTYDEPRLSEMAETYEELGFEVLVEPFVPAGSPDCSECMMAEPGRYRTLWTRPGNGREGVKV